MFTERFKSGSRKFKEGFKEGLSVFQETFREMSMMFQESFKGVSSKIEGISSSFKVVLRVFERRV